MKVFKGRKPLGIVISAVLLVVMSFGLVGCASPKEKITQDEYDKTKKAVTLGCGLTVSELEDTMVKFTYNVYNPQKEKDIVDGIELIKGITSDAEYKELISIAGKYEATKKSTVSNVVAKYSSKGNNTDGMEKVYIEFTMTSDKFSQNTAIEFVFNPNNKIFKHYIWTSNIVEK